MKSLVISLPQSVEQSETISLKYRLKMFFRQYGLVIFFLVLIISGMILGTINTVSSAPEKLNNTDKLFLSVPISFVKKTPFSVFADSFSASFVCVAALCFFSLSPAGIPAIPVLVFFKGYEYGVFAGYLCISQGFSGLAYFLSTAFAGIFLSSLAIIYFAQYCIGFSFSILLAVIGGDSAVPLKKKLVQLFLNGAYSLIIIVFSSLTDTLLYFIIGKLFP